MIEYFQDQAQLTLAKYNQISHHPPTRYFSLALIFFSIGFSPLFRFGRLLLSLSSLRGIPSQWIEKTYFSSRSISKILVDMLLIETKK